MTTATNADEGISACLLYQPDLLILDLSLPDKPGQLVAEALAQVNPNARLIVLSAQASSFVCAPGLQTILHAVVDKIEAFETLSAEINDLLQIDNTARSERLTPREHDVLQQIGQGLTNNQISGALQISVRTVETHRKNLALKLGLKGAELVRYATLQTLQPSKGRPTL